ncbi:putative amidoligase enzyme-domain-containing protein [Hypoxylon sp. FL1150]|nr:putative amidoligase enzyme-domain-containing protein [Hypoxylon sp. FL1150]
MTSSEYSSSDDSSADDSSEEPIIPKFDGIIETPNDGEGPLTFGLELEFLVPVLVNNAWSDPHPQDGRIAFRHDCDPGVPWLDLDHQTLNDSFQKQTRHALEKACGLAFRLAKEDIWHQPHGNVPHYNVCRLSSDATVKFEGRHFTNYRPYEWDGMEVTTEVLDCDDDPAFYQQRIIEVCRSIRSMRVHLNETCGVHVHVGHGDESFSLVTMKKFATLIFLADEQLLQLHHPSRRNNHHCQVLSNSSFIHKLTIEGLLADGRAKISSVPRQEMNTFIPARHDFRHMRQILQATKGIEELAKVMGDESYPTATRGTVGFRRFLPAGRTGGNTHTFEFRQMVGCLDPEPIIHWVRVCTAFTDFARLSTPEKYKDLLSQMMDNTAFSGFDLLLALGLVEEEKYFRAKTQAWSQGRELELYDGEEDGLLFVPKM